MKADEPCPCGGKAYGVCCGPLHEGRPAVSAEALMRSRYSAFVLGLDDYLLATWHPDTRPEKLDLAAEPAAKWLGLEVKRHEQSDESHAVVEFVARYRVAGRGQRLHETSRFLRVEGRWLYLDGEFDGDGR